MSTDANTEEAVPKKRRQLSLPSFMTHPKDLHEWVWLAIRILIFVLLLAYMFGVPEWYSNTKNGVTTYKWLLLFNVLAGVAVMFVLPCFRLKLPKWVMPVIEVIEAFGLPMLAIYRAERIHKYDLFAINPKYIVFNYLIVFSLFLVVLVITNRIRWAAMTAYLVTIIFSMANFYVNKFRGDPINAADIYVAGTALNVVSAYQFNINRRLYQALFEAGILISLMNWLPAEEPFLRKKARIAFDVIAAGAAIFIIRLFAITDWPLRQGVQVKVFKPMYTYKLNGELLNFLRGFYYMIIQEPDGYSGRSAVEQMKASGYVSDTPDTDDGKPNPNIIVMMNESLTDFSNYEMIETSKDPLPFYHSLEQSGAANVITGDLHVDVHGGRTANTEYEFLTGNSIAFLPYNTVPYALFVRTPTPSVTWNFRDLGYSGNDAFHPFKANGYSRPRAYPNLGFEEFISIETIEATVTEDEYLRSRISDDADFKRIIGYYEEAKKESDAPFYMFNVTMQNHGGFKTDYDNFIQDITISGEFKDDDQLQRFENLCEYSDEAFRMMTEYFSQTDDPTILVMFGDHQPAITGDFYKKIYGKSVNSLKGEEMFQRYVTPLVIWANYDINPDGMYDELFDNISINYLSSSLMKVAGIPMTAYQKFEYDMASALPVLTAHGYLDSTGAYYALDDDKSPYYDLINEYYTYEYNYQFDRKNRYDDFFMLDTDSRAFSSK